MIRLRSSVAKRGHVSHEATFKRHFRVFVVFEITMDNLLSVGMVVYSPWVAYHTMLLAIVMELIAVSRP